ncbi:MAG: dTMP kinase [Bacteroidetes bacterium GWF2_38_335]|nr:MAG: dTMP kinase [Bacteroidetes bacterium GWF2_38_335]OFY78815.1 MAG: dTMP kinase [Bacteroidetes bacterium RIFOXYA12_FULL_38_20]HBS85212.1 dTMP kinase [Bacteroidales bacterium]
MKFIVIEGLDGSGKSTQIKLLKEYLENNNIRYKYLHFPRTDAPYYGELIAMFLRGEFGDLKQVSPYLVALIYAGDRMDASSMIRTWLDEGYLVLVDRYVYSNIAFQCAKLEKSEDRTKLMEWIFNLEFDYHKIPRPELNILLDVPFQFTEQKLSKNRCGEDRDYLNGKKDIHEASLDFQKTVREVYLEAVKNDPAFCRIDCSNNSEMAEKEQIFEKVISVLKSKNII